MSGATGARTFTFLALALSAVSCFVMQHQMKTGSSQDFWNGAFICYLLIGIGVAFLTFACFEEIMHGMREKMMSSRWCNMTSEEGGMIVYVQAACTV